MNNIINKINEVNNILVCCHINPDGDAIGSSLGLSYALQDIGKKVDVVIPEYPYEFNYLKGNINIVNMSEKEYDLAIVVDTSSIDRVSLMNNELDRCKEVIVIDHHISNTNFGNINYVNSDSSSCCEIIYDLLNKMNIFINKIIATCLITGIITDTCGYLNSNTNSRTLDISSKLLQYDISLHDIYYKLLVMVSKNKFYLTRLVYDRLEFYDNGRIAFSYLNKDDIESISASSGDTTGMVDIGRAIQSVQLSLFVKEEELGYKVSIRSNSGISTLGIASSFGGGGHTAASGCTIKGDLDTVKKSLLEEARKYLI